MSSSAKTKTISEFGDFQTPVELARESCRLLSRMGFNPTSIIEPTCGQGNFLFAALDSFPNVTKAIGLDISRQYVETAKAKLLGRDDRNKTRIIHGDFFNEDWPTRLKELRGPMLVIGNPPWITNAQLSVLQSSNLPEKTNFQGHIGLDALTGKSNFDISEWMLIRVLHWLDKREAMMAMLCKTAVARKLLTYAWKNNINLSDSAFYRINSLLHFGASVDACLLVCRFSPSSRNIDSHIYGSIDDLEHERVIGSRDGELVASVELYKRWKHLQGTGAHKWRSGIKHDCAKVMELTREGDKFRNGLGELIDLESHYIYPMLKSSDIAKGSTSDVRRWMLVTQQSVRDDTSQIKDAAPKTWRYLVRHSSLLDRRGSTIYKNRPRFSVFGVGEYSFAPWKVAISGFYKSLDFRVVGNLGGRPIVLDDTSYFIPCESETQARDIARLLNSDVAKEFYEAFIFWDAKRPITIELLRRLDLDALVSELLNFAH